MSWHFYTYLWFASVDAQIDVAGTIVALSSLLAAIAGMVAALSARRHAQRSGCERRRRTHAKATRRRSP